MVMMFQPIPQHKAKHIHTNDFWVISNGMQNLLRLGWAWASLIVLWDEWEKGEPHDTVCNYIACKYYYPHHMTSGTFQGGYIAMIIAWREHKRFCTLQTRPTQTTAKAYTHCTCRDMTVVRSYLVLPPTVIKALSDSLMMLSHSSNDGRVWVGRRLRSVSLDFRNTFRITSSS